MTQTLALNDYACPECGARARLDPRFVQWCSDCGHGAETTPSRPEGRRARRRSGREQQRALRLYASLRTAPNLRPASAVRLAVTALATAVHLSSLALLVLPVLLVVAEHGAVWSIAVLCYAELVFVAVRPRFFGRRLDPRAAVDRAQAPAFYALIDRCAAELDCPAPDHVRFDLRFNASTGQAGLRRTRWMSVGMPLWTVLSGRERLALLGHELAHRVNGDISHGVWATAARRTIHVWTRLLDPRQSRRERMTAAAVSQYRLGPGSFGSALAPILMAVLLAPFFLLALGARALMTRLDLYCGQRAEYLADELGARLAGSEAALGCLAALALGEPILADLAAARNRHRLRRGGDTSGLWRDLAAYAASVPETERQRRRIVDRLHNVRSDRSHPANHLRLALVAERPQLAAAFTVTDEEWAVVDAELAACARTLAGAYLGA